MNGHCQPDAVDTVTDAIPAIDPAVVPVPVAATALTAHFRAVHERHMRDLPISNAALTVETCAWQAWQSYWLGVLITPWCMNLVLLDRDIDTPHMARRATGTTSVQGFPAGEYAFTVNHAEHLGNWLSCSLFSPMAEFADQAFARAVAEQSVQALLTRDADTDASIHAPTTLQTDQPVDAGNDDSTGELPSMTRRAWLRATLQRGRA